ncbi:uncharacterized protein E0L32_003215 [Thyridium curvatum]|uniref:diphosphoinositol-polyphosphate diphosphatase n=1 Tax=Thyridium curvatum TaxID=1093900 RepID=A0A507BB17_9PEZI|nr:uncharacterized protein E0L32_003215 [Thyridium curvatum]TPX17097.1 hypothetical protein E0L32_003215 [Thyridium curvatum]
MTSASTVAEGWEEMTDSGNMVSKRSVRAYVEDEDQCQVVDTTSKRNSRCEEDSSASSATTTRRASTSSSRTGSDISSASHPEQATVDLGAELEELLGPEGATTSGEVGVLLADFGEALSLPKRFSVPSTRAGQPINFGMVVPGVYRSSYPQAQDYDFIRSLKLKSIVTLVDKDFPEGYKAFITANGIHHYVFSMKGTKKEEIPIKTMKAILRLVLDRRNHPLLIHCNHGKHRTGCVVAIIRKVTGWDLPVVLDEYRAYAEPKVRDCDLQYISSFKLTSLSHLFSKDTTALGFRVPNFFRYTFFTLCVLIIWYMTGNRMTAPSKRAREI